MEEREGEDTNFIFSSSCIRGAFLQAPLHMCPRPRCEGSTHPPAWVQGAGAPLHLLQSCGASETRGASPNTKSFWIHRLIVRNRQNIPPEKHVDENVLAQV